MRENGYEISLSSGNTELYLSPYSVCRVMSGGLSGFDFPQISVEVESSADGGYSVIDRYLKPRILKIRFEVTDPKQNVAVCDKLRKLMNPKSEILLRTYLNGRDRKISVIPGKGIEIEHDSFTDPLYITAEFTAVEPYFTDGRKIKRKFPDVVPLLSFPLSFMSGVGATCSFATGGTVSGSVTNYGDAECGAVIKVLSARGSVTNPTVSCGGKYIKYDGVLSEGDELIFCTIPDALGVMLNGINTYSFTRDSEFFKLAAGDNYIRLGADSGAVNADVSVEYQPLYLGA